MQLEVGKIYAGKVTGITKFGAFVELEKGTTGMVHISEVANTFVNDINEHLKDGQEVNVKVMSLGDNGKIALSIKKALPEEPRKKFDNKGRQGGRNNGRQNGGRNNAPRRNFDKTEPQQDFSKNPPPVYDPNANSGDANFEDMLNQFKARSEERFSDLKHVMDNKRKGYSRKR